MSIVFGNQPSLDVDLNRIPHPHHPNTHAQNQLQPVFPNTAVRFAFYGGLKQQASTSYEERLNCSRHDMRPQLVSLEASWDVFTSYGFNVSTDAPLAPASGSSSAYYSINPTQLRNSVPGLAALSSTLPITFRAEYKCLWYVCEHVYRPWFIILDACLHILSHTLMHMHTQHTTQPAWV